MKSVTWNHRRRSLTNSSEPPSVIDTLTANVTPTHGAGCPRRKQRVPIFRDISVLVEEQFITFYFTYSMLNMFRTLIHPSSGACDFSILSPHWLCVLVSMCVGVSVWLGYSSGIRVAGWSSVVLQPATRIPPQRSHTETPTHIETRTHNQCGDTIENSQAPDDGFVLQPSTRIPLPQPSYTETPIHIETRTDNKCGDTIEKSQAPDDG